jgi:peptide subunit release factor 1 (eRF1)
MRCWCHVSRHSSVALWLGAVQRLVVAEGAHRDGSECPRCRRLEPGAVGRCPACSSVMQPVHDLFDAGMERTLEQSGRVEVLHADAPRRLLERGDGLGALLRYRTAPTPVPD